MGNCQAAEAAAVVIQRPGGKVERLYGPATAADVMRSNPGHYVALVVLRVSAVSAKQDPAIAGTCGGGAARVTKVKLLKPKDALHLGQVYRLITSLEVAMAVQARRQGKTRSCEETVDDRPRAGAGHATAAAGSQKQGQQSTDQAGASERMRSEKDHRHRGGSGRGRHWQPSLQSISEFPS